MLVVTQGLARNLGVFTRTEVGIQTFEERVDKPRSFLKKLLGYPVQQDVFQRQKVVYVKSILSGGAVLTLDAVSTALTIEDGRGNRLIPAPLRASLFVPMEEGFPSAEEKSWLGRFNSASYFDRVKPGLMILGHDEIGVENDNNTWKITQRIQSDGSYTLSCALRPGFRNLPYSFDNEDFYEVSSVGQVRGSQIVGEEAYETAERGEDDWGSWPRGVTYRTVTRYNSVTQKVEGRETDEGAILIENRRNGKMLEIKPFISRKLIIGS